MLERLVNPAVLVLRHATRDSDNPTGAENQQERLVLPAVNTLLNTCVNAVGPESSEAIRQTSITIRVWMAVDEDMVPAAWRHAGTAGNCAKRSLRFAWIIDEPDQ